MPSLCEGARWISGTRMENRPTLMNGSEAWWLVDGEWRMLDTSEAFMNAIFIG